MSQAGLQLAGSGRRTEKNKWNAATRNLSPYMLQCMSYSCAEIACSGETVACIMTRPLFVSALPPGLPPSSAAFFLTLFSFSLTHTYTQNTLPPSFLQSHIWSEESWFLDVLFLKISKALKLFAKLIMTVDGASAVDIWRAARRSLKFCMSV